MHNPVAGRVEDDRLGVSVSGLEPQAEQQGNLCHAFPPQARCLRFVYAGRTPAMFHHEAGRRVVELTRESFDAGLMLAEGRIAAEQ